MRTTLIATVLLTGCATVLNGSQATIHVAANPGAPITVDGQPAGRSPADITVGKHDDHVIVVGEQSCRLTASGGGGWIVLDIITGILPLIIDGVTGAWKSIDADSCQL